MKKKKRKEKENRRVIEGRDLKV